MGIASSLVLEKVKERREQDRKKQQTRDIKDSILLKVSQNLGDNTTRLESVTKVIEKIPDSVEPEDFLSTVKTLFPAQFQTQSKRRKEQLDLQTSIAKANELGVPIPFDQRATGQRITQATFQPSTVQQAIGSAQPRGQFPTQVRAQGPIVRQKEIESKVEISKQREAQLAKDQLKAETDFRRVEGRVRNATNIFIDAVKEQKAITGLDPGFLSGVTINALQPFQTNKFTDALKGAFIQTAAASSRISLPGSRGGVRMLKIFEKTTIKEGQTVESAIETSAFDLKNGGVEVAAQFPWEFVNMTKAQWEGLSIDDKIKLGGQINQKVQKIGDDFRQMTFESLFKNPDSRSLLKQKTRDELFDNLPQFETEEEGDASLSQGRLYRIGDRLKEAT